MANWKEKLIVPRKLKESIIIWALENKAIYSLGREDSGQDVVQKFKAPQN